MGWLIALGVVIMLAVIPLGVSVKYDSEGVLAKVILGPIRLTVFPVPKKEKKESKPQKKAAAQMEPSEPEKPLPQPPQPPKPEKTKKEPTGGSWTDFLPFVELVMDLLADFRRKLRLDNLQLKLIMAAEDPCDLAINYGRAWAAVGNLMPQLERLFIMKKRDVEVECDFTASQTLVIARLDLTITLGRLVALAGVHGIRAVKELLLIMKKRKGGAVV